MFIAGEACVYYTARMQNASSEEKTYHNGRFLAASIQDVALRVHHDLQDGAGGLPQGWDDGGQVRREAPGMVHLQSNVALFSSYSTCHLLDCSSCKLVHWGWGRWGV